MGTCASALTADQINEIEASLKIDSTMVNQYRENLSIIKLLFLGAGESGKSTVFKQMRILYGEGFPEAERAEFKSPIHANILEAMKYLCVGCQTLELMDHVMAHDEYNIIISIPDEMINEKGFLTEEYARAIRILWNDPAIQEAWFRRSELQIIDSAKYYFDDIDRIASFNYLPSVEDVLRIRVRTSGIVEEHFRIDNTNFMMIDVGGQRNERKKWIHQFEGVNAVIFVVALNEYDQSLFEDNTVNRMLEAMDLFEKICNNQFFVEISMLLFLNKRDLFEEKVKIKNIGSVEPFSDYSGKPNSYVDGLQYFKDKFTELNKNPSKNIFIQETCATDTDQVRFVFDSCKKIILAESLALSGFSS